MIDRRKHLEDAAAKWREENVSFTPDGPDYEEAFLSGAEWADANNVEIPLLRSALERIARGPLNRVHTVYPRCYCDDCLSPQELAQRVLAAQPPSAETPHPKPEGSEDRGT